MRLLRAAFTTDQHHPQQHSVGSATGRPGDACPSSWPGPAARRSEAIASIGALPPKGLPAPDREAPGPAAACFSRVMFSIRTAPACVPLFAASTAFPATSLVWCAAPSTLQLLCQRQQTVPPTTPTTRTTMSVASNPPFVASAASWAPRALSTARAMRCLALLTWDCRTEHHVSTKCLALLTRACRTERQVSFEASSANCLFALNGTSETSLLLDGAEACTSETDL
mmetsp:Transcript_69859/g.185696  ORF Transcript_69859/g.185696 Transcript_69859/m.185696 type:complete len:226 (-) Transcript_69859:201-878(-)